MARVKRGVMHAKRRKNLLAQAKGYMWRGKNTITAGKVRVMKATRHAWVDRRRKKREARTLWQIKINAAVRPLGFSYSKFINVLKKNNVAVDRKIMADLALNNPQVFERFVNLVK